MSRFAMMETPTAAKNAWQPSRALRFQKHLVDKPSKSIITKEVAVYAACSVVEYKFAVKNWAIM